ncbi:MAG: hypothetical protein JRH20_08520 [Deltaproteobacteria bacterium]|nr:hypothetical protein [Deltaproteobacteria bacterium]
MGASVDARDVLDPNAITVRGFSAQHIGYFTRTGPNSWDDYEYRAKEGEDLEVMPRIRIQLERFGCELRMRREGRVIRVRWIPNEGDLARTRRLSKAAQRDFFSENYLDIYANSAGVGAAAVIASKLRE